MKSQANDIRSGFLDYFRRHGHTIVKSSSLVPAQDPTLIFTNAGMVQFKDVFIGAETRPYSRATSCQKCLRVSGKHNDLEEVGRTRRHHTFFEMLGNFSFGDYFKAEAIELAWGLITKEWGLARERLYVTVFGGDESLPADLEARALWRKVSGLSEHRILDMGAKDNFWAMGDTGPCGPCTEIHYDMGGEGEISTRDFENGRLVEIWNNVFMQFERQKDGALAPLAKTGVDTGMGLERIAAITQGKSSNYDTDLFLPLIEAVAKKSGKPYTHGEGDDDVSMRVIADHARTTAMLTADGVQPANEGKSYVMRRIMRRAIRHGARLGLSEGFFAEICAEVVALMGAAYPELTESRSLISKVAKLEEKSFRRTLDTGLRILGEQIEEAKQRGEGELKGDVVFKLYDTYGFPKDLTLVIAKEHGLDVDQPGFEAQMQAQKARSRGDGAKDAVSDNIYKELLRTLGETLFVGYPHEDIPPHEREGDWRLRTEDGVEYLEAACVVKAILCDGARVSAIDERSCQEAEVLCDPTPLYGESGGQVGDLGILSRDNGFRAEVRDTIRPLPGLCLAKTQVRVGELREGDRVFVGYPVRARKRTRAHHSATHLLHAALREVLGEHVKQAGSLVTQDHLRFDYAHFAAPSRAELLAIEEAANARVAQGYEIVTEVLPFAVAKERGALAFFGDKYGDFVRMISMGPSTELCGGTHAANTRELEMILIVREEAVASGVRRLEAVVGEAAQELVAKTAARLDQVAALLERQDGGGEEDNPVFAAVNRALRHAAELAAKLDERGLTRTPRAAVTIDRASSLAPRAVLDLWQALVMLANSRQSSVEELVATYAPRDSGVVAAYAALLEANREDERLLEKSEREQHGRQAADLIQRARAINGIKVLTARCDGVATQALRELADELRERLGSGILAIGGQSDGKATLLLAVTKDLSSRFHAGKLIAKLAPLIGGKGGGKPDLASAGGSKPEALEEAFAALDKAVEGD